MPTGKVQFRFSYQYACRRACSGLDIPSWLNNLSESLRFLNESLLCLSTLKLFGLVDYEGISCVPFGLLADLGLTLSCLAVHVTPSCFTVHIAASWLTVHITPSGLAVHIPKAAVAVI